MTVLLFIALAMGICGLAAFLWAFDSQQFDDLDGAGARMINDQTDRPE